MTTTDILAIGTMANGEKPFFFLNGATDGTETELKVFDLAGNTKSIGDALKGKTLRKLEVQCTDGSILSTLRLYDKAGGRAIAGVGCERTSNQRTNLTIDHIRIQIEDGMLLKVNTTD